MPITNDTFGNYYMGNFIGGNLVDWTEVLSCFRQALGSDDRANLNKDNLNLARIDWRPNLVAETLTEVISPPSHPFIFRYSYDLWRGTTLTNGSRLAFAYNWHNHSFFPGGGEINAIPRPNSIELINPTTDTIWVVANKQSISFFIYRSPSFHYFYSQGFLLNSPLTFPQNAYTIVASYNGLSSYNSGPIYAYQARGFAGTVVKTMHETGVKANYNHTKLSDGLPTQSEVELYLRDASNDVPYGYVPNIFKWKVDGNEVAPDIGDVVRLNMANATGEYAGHGNIFCIVVGRSGAVVDTDLTGDYILMRVAS